MSSNEKLHCCKVPFVLRYHVPNKHKYSEQYAHHLLFLFYPFRDEFALLSECDETYTSKLIEQHVLEVVNRNKSIIEPHENIFDSAFPSFKIQQPHNMDSFLNKKTRRLIRNLN